MRMLLTAEVPARLENTEYCLRRETVVCFTTPQTYILERRKELICNPPRSSLVE